MGTNSISSNLCLNGENETPVATPINRSPSPTLEILANPLPSSAFNPFPASSLVSETRYANGNIVRVFGEAPRSFDDYLNPQPVSTTPLRPSLSRTALTASHDFQVTQAAMGGEILVLFWLAALVGGRPVEAGRLRETGAVPRELQGFVVELRRLREQGANTGAWVANLRAEIEVLQGRIESLRGAHTLEVQNATRRLEQAQERYRAALDLYQETRLERQGSGTRFDRELDEANRQYAANRADESLRRAFHDALARRNEYLSRGLTSTHRFEAASRAYESAVSETRAAERALAEMRGENRNAGAYDSSSLTRERRDVERRIRFLQVIQRIFESPLQGEVPDLSRLIQQLSDLPRQETLEAQRNGIVACLRDDHDGVLSIFDREHPHLAESSPAEVEYLRALSPVREELATSRSIRIGISEHNQRVVYSSQSESGRFAEFPTSEVRLRALNDSIPVSERVLADANARLIYLGGRIENVVAAHTRQSTAALTERLEAVRSEIARLDGPEGEVAQALRGVRERAGDHPDLRELSAKRAELQQFRQEARTLEEQIRERRAQIAELQQELQEIEARFRHGSNANNRFQSLNGLVDSIHDTRAALEAARAQVDSLHFERDTLRLIRNLQDLNVNAFGEAFAADGRPF